jgi:hypothetical protein
VTLTEAGGLGRSSFGVRFGGELIGLGVVIEQFGVSAPPDGDVESLLGGSGTESLLTVTRDVGWLVGVADSTTVVAAPAPL